MYGHDELRAMGGASGVQLKNHSSEVELFCAKAHKEY